MQQLHCKKCGCEFSGPLASNAMYLCPKCKEYVNCLCEYGFGPIVPCSIFLGDREIARIIPIDGEKIDTISSDKLSRSDFAKAVYNIEKEYGFKEFEITDDKDRIKTKSK